MAVLINEIDQTFFELNSKRYYKTYQPLAQGLENVSILNIYDSRQQILNSTKFDELVIDGVVPTSQSDAVNKLLDLVFAIDEQSTMFLKNTTDTFTGILTVEGDIEVESGNHIGLKPSDNSFLLRMDSRTGNGGSLHQFKDNAGAAEAWRESWWDGDSYVTATASLNAFKFEAPVISTSSFTAMNPTNAGASVALDWLNDIPRIRTGGNGAGSSAPFEIQGAGDVVRASFSSNGNLTIGGYFTTGLTNYKGGTIEHIGTEFSFLNNGAALAINTNELLVSNSYANRNLVPDNGAYIKGNVTSGGAITADNFILTSDERFKKNIQSLEPNAIKCNWKSFEMKGKNRVGVIAQELELEHPEFVESNDEGFKSVAYIDLLCAKMAEKDAQIDKLIDRMEKLEKNAST